MGVCCASGKKDLSMPERFKIVPEGDAEGLGSGWRVATADDVKPVLERL